MIRRLCAFESLKFTLRLIAKCMGRTFWHFDTCLSSNDHITCFKECFKISNNVEISILLH